MQWMRLLTGSLYLAAGAFAQTPRFEVASIRPHQPPTPRISISTTGPRLIAEATTTFGLITWAYGLKNYQISPAPALSRSEALYTMYDVAAKAEGEAEPTQDQFRHMLQGLLADRFKLKTHRESREMEVYALVIGKSGPKLKPSSADGSPMGYMHVEGRNYHATRAKATMDDIVQAIANSFLDRPVVDHTGLDGNYVLDLTYTPDIRSNRGDPDPGDISIFTAVQEQLGLRLEPQKASVEVLAIDSVEKPSEN